MAFSVSKLWTTVIVVSVFLFLGFFLYSFFGFGTGSVAGGVGDSDECWYIFYTSEDTVGECDVVDDCLSLAYGLGATSSEVGTFNMRCDGGICEYKGDC